MAELKLLNVDQYTYTRERRRFGRPCQFVDKTRYLFSIQPNLRRRFQFVLRNPIDRATQLSTQFADSEVETINPEFAEHGMSHLEGGWPKDVNLRDEEQTQRYRKKIERDDDWGPQITHLLRDTLFVAAQNSAVSIYEKFFADLPPDLAQALKRSFQARTSHIFRDSMQLARPVTFLNWSPAVLNNFLVQYTNFAAIPIGDDIAWAAFESERLIPKRQHHTYSTSGSAASRLTDWTDDCTDNAFFVWSYDNPLKPANVLDADEIVRRACFCPKDVAFIAGGFQSGSVAVWNSRESSKPSMISPLETSHREALSAVCWVHSKSNSEFYTGSSDGSIKYWDARNLNAPTQEVLLDPTFGDEQRRDRAEGVAVLDFEYTIPVRYIAASDHGRIFVGNRKGTTPSDTLVANYHLFSGPIRTIERNPFFVKNFLISADWCAKVWAEDCKDYATTLVFKRKSEVLCGCWSTTRSSLLVTGDEKGNLDFWDLLLSHREPIFTMHYNSAITSVTFRSDGEFLAIGLENGDVYLIEMDWAMRSCTSKDKTLMMALFEREQLRCKILEGRVEEVKMKHFRAEQEEEFTHSAEAAAASAASALSNLNPDDPAQFMQLLEADTEFADVVANFKEMTFALDKKRLNRIHVMEQTDFEIYEDYLNSTYGEWDEGAHPSPPVDTMSVKSKKKKGN